MLKVSDEFDQILVAKTYEAEQQHVFTWWEELDQEQRRALLDQLGRIDFQQLGKLTKLLESDEPAEQGDISPTPIERPAPERRADLEALGWDALRAGKVACLVVAGGQGTRLGWDAPKGTFPVGPVSEKTLFQVFAEQVIATGQRAGRPLHWYVLTSSTNREETERFLAEHAWFGLDPDQVTILVQRDLPATDAQGHLLLEEKHRIAMSPNGHGGTFEALRDGPLRTMKERGVEHLFYFQVDNPLCRVADPVFLGAHIDGQAEVSTKVVRKEDPDEKIGLLAQRNGRTCVVEYSEMSPEQQRQRDPDGQLTYRGGNTAIHVFARSFLERLVDAGFELPYHVAKKKVPYIDAKGEKVEPTEPNGRKFETFIFDLLPQAQRHVALEVEREEEFEPLKNAEGPYSPETVRRAQSARARRWLERAGAEVPEAEAYEVSPLTALDPEELQAKRPDLSIAPQDGKLLV